jgi:predicted DNA-binding transcriptional regulator YafY
MVGPTTRTFDKVGVAVNNISVSSGDDVADAFQDRLAVDVHVLGGQAPDTMTGADLPTLLKAFAQRRMLSIRYKKGYNEKDRDLVICPVKLVFWQGHPYFVCMPFKPGHDRSVYVKLSRIAWAKILDEPFEPTEEYLAEVNGWIKNSFGIWDNPEDKPAVVELRFPVHLRNALQEWATHYTQSIRMTPKYLTLTMKVPLGPDLVFWILKWQGEAKIVKPAALKRKVKAAVEALADSYA